MRLDSTATISVVLTSIMACISANATTTRHSCNSHPTKQIHQTDDRPENDSSSGNDHADDDDDDRDELNTCKARCDAQWKSDFYMQFQKNYDEEFYEFPLDATITASLTNFYTFCNITKQKMSCWNAQCRINPNDIAWSSDLHICGFERLQFENALSCLNSTSAGAHNECNGACRRLARRYRTRGNEKRYLYGTTTNLAEIYHYRQLNKQCAFQICQLECRKELMRNLCEENETISALDVLQDYYTYDLLDQLHSMAGSSTEHLFPLMCRLYLPVQYQLKLNNETSNEIKQSILSIKYEVNGIAEMLAES